MKKILASNEEAIEILLWQFDKNRVLIKEGGRWENEAEFLAEKELFEGCVKSLDLEEYKLSLVNAFIYGKESYSFDELDEDELDFYRKNALYVDEKKEIIIVNF